MQFRKDINGLRAIAVIAVVLFHFNASWLPGGFAGVDVFFVISGFLMTSIIFRGLENNSFNLFKFYVARANRIIPALAVLCIVLLIFGWFYLAPLDYRSLGKHVASSMGFLSNVIYWRESGYFDAASHEKWLLHTWSLSVEWQFYIIYPIVLVALKRFLSLENLKRLIVVGTVLGFIFSVVATMKWPDPAYYLLPTRAWEMMMGGGAFLYPWSISENKKKITEIIGLTLILISYAFVSSGTPWPGHFALIPVLGSYLMIVSNQQSSFITNNKVFQNLGKWSYSIYLWHWPVVVFLYYFDFDLTPILGVLASIVLGGVSYALFERKVSSGLIIKLTSVFFLGLGVFVSNGVQSHYPENILKLSENSHGAGFKCKSEPCYIENGKEVDSFDNADFIVFGDSHSGNHLQTIVSSIGSKKIIFAGSSACLFIPNLELKNKGTNMDKCYKSIDDLYGDIIPNNPSAKLIMVQRLNIYFNGFGEGEFVTNSGKLLMKPRDQSENLEGVYLSALCGLNERNQVFVTKPTPEFKFSVSSKVFRDAYLGNEFIKMGIKELNERNVYSEKLLLKLESCGVSVLDPTPYLCDGQYCYSEVNGNPIYTDYSHFTSFGISLLEPMYKKQFSFAS